MALSPELCKKMYKDMWRIRLFEEEAHRQTSLGSVVGALHMYCGEEAVAVGVCGNLRDDDYVLGTHRSHGHCIAKGAKPNQMMAELFGKATGTCAGKGGSMHIADFSLNMLGANGIVGRGDFARYGRGARQQDARDGSGVGLFLRRRRRRAGHFPRGHRVRRIVEAAGGLRLREQSISAVGAAVECGCSRFRRRYGGVVCHSRRIH